MRPPARRLTVLAASALTLGVAMPAVADKGWSVGPAPAWVEPVPVPTEATIAAKDVSSGMHYLLADHQVSVANGSSEQYYHWAWKVLAPSGLQQASELRMRFDPAYQRLLIHHVRLTRNGQSVGSWTPGDVKVIQQENNLDQRIYDESLTALIFLKDVRPGDVLDYAYTVQGQNPILEGRFVGRLTLAYTVPVSLVRHRILWPRARTLHQKGHGTTLEPRTTQDGDRIVYLWEQRDVPALAHEDRLPSWHDPVPWVQVSEFGSWAEVAGWAAKLFAGQNRTSPALDRLAAEWKTIGSEEERARTAVRMVQDEVRYLGIEIGPNSHQPHSPAQVLAQRFGDCKDKALLLSVLLGKLGVAATPVLVNTRARHQLDEWLPTPFAFDHAIVQVLVDGNLLWIDATHSQQGGPLTASAAPPFERALVVREGETGLTTIARSESTQPTTLIEETYVVPAAGKPGALRVLATYTGPDADAMRSDLDSESAAERARTYLNFYARKNPKIRAVEPPVVQDSRAANIVTVTEHYELPEFWDDGERSFRAWPVVERLEKPDTTLRTRPLSVRHPVHVRYRLKLEGLASWPQPDRVQVVSDSAFRFSRQAERSAGAFVLTYDYRSLADFVPPTAIAGHLGHIDDVYRGLDYSLDEAEASSAPLGGRSLPGDIPGSPRANVWVGIVLSVAFLAAWLRLGVPWLRLRKRRRAYSHLLRYPSGATPETALRVASAADARERLRRMACACGAALDDDGQWSECRYDGRVMTVVARQCAACRETQTVYVDLPRREAMEA